ncbi:MAG: NYN domain-containing protein [Parachlamydiaceae bacterium]|nr:NYN domain-containing protein [Parachlamydiaceae bacterium]
MHYCIDGYNLLFYLFGTGKNELRSQRDQLIQSLNIKIESLSLNLSIVFDSHLCPGEATRSHFHHLEVLYSAEGVTADDFIIQMIANARNPTKEVVVTNDRELAMRAKHHRASTQNIENFLNWLNRRYSNQFRKNIVSSGKFKERPSSVASSPSSKKPLNPNTLLKSEPLPRIKLIPLPEPVKPLIPIIEDPKNAQGSFDFYLSKFQAENEKILEQEMNIKQEKKIKQGKLAKVEQIRGKPKKKDKNLSSLFKEPKQQNPNLPDMERWLKIFEDHDKKK